MKSRKNLAIISLAMLSLTFSAASMANSAFSKMPPQRSVEMCVAEIADHADYATATRVRHDVESEQRHTVGHILRIDTRVYGNADGKLIREYATKCVVGNGNEPYRFKIEEVLSRS